ncbi:gamma carbonic anhydrase family protein [Campylobacter sputorum]|uniref:gamma carbonic anhydrase family protein n=1 Tax=Campylobacter sputorum TaxID=206 RepID=UPI00053BE38E|nr:gamma carbonic anhydrase family protein [Campylobacter sputorum]
MNICFNGNLPKIHKNVFIASGAKIIGDVHIDDDSSVWFNCVLRGDVNFIKIGKKTNIQDLTTIHVWHKEFDKNGNFIDEGSPVIIGNEVTIGHNCVIHGCKIQDRVLIGMNSTIMDGVIIGEDCIVGAGSLITKNKKFPPYSLILGNPAKLIRKLSDEEIKSIKDSAISYVKFKNNYKENG